MPKAPLKPFEIASFMKEDTLNPLSPLAMTSLINQNHFQICLSPLINGHIFPRFIIEFYHKFQLIRNVHDMSLSIGFTIRNKEFIMSLKKFSQVLQIPYKGTCFFSKECSLELLNTDREKHISYQTNLPNIRDVVQNICFPSSHRNCLNPTIILLDNLLPNIKDWELIIQENVICVDAHKSSIDACSAIMLPSSQELSKL
ncbi:hypothetical protein Tco_0915758 [Tanacetum coccineum]